MPFNNTDIPASMPASDLPVSEFLIRNNSDLEHAARWANSVVADIAHKSDDEILMAAKTLAANDASQRKAMLDLIDIMEK